MDDVPWGKDCQQRFPRALTTFVGRDAEVARVTELLQRGRLVTIVGPGGAGKTRLAVEALRGCRIPAAAGTWFVDLAPVTAPDGVAVATLEALGTARTSLHDLEALVERVGELELVLLLDNCEHVLEPVARLAEAVLRSCPNAKILATSREQISVAGEVFWRLAGLELPKAMEGMPYEELAKLEAVALFAARGLDANPAFELTEENSPDVMRILRAVDALPLGIELAAARLSSLSARQLGDRLQRRDLALLRGRGRGIPARQRTMEATVAWSYDLLSSKEQAILRRLSVFNGGWTLEAAEEICADSFVGPDEIVDVLHGLVSQSLVIADVVAERPRYRCFETIRAFAGANLEAEGEAQVFGARHCRWFRDFAEQAAEGMSGQSQREWMDQLEADIDNVRSAMTWAEHHSDALSDGLNIAGHLQEFWHYRGYGVEALERTQRLLAQEHGDRQARTRALVTATWAAMNTTPFVVSSALAEKALGLSRELEDDGLLAQALHASGHNLVYPGRPAGARSLLDEARQLAEATGNSHLLARVIHSLSVVHAGETDHESSMALVREGLGLAEANEDGILRAVFLMQLGDGARCAGDYRNASDYLHAALSQAEKLKLRRIRGLVELNLGLLAVTEGDEVDAKHYLRRALLRAQLDADRGYAATTIVALASMSWHDVDAPRAAGWLAALEGILPGFEVSWTDQPVRLLAESRVAELGNAGPVSVGGASRTMPGLVREVLAVIGEVDDHGWSNRSSSRAQPELRTVPRTAGGRAPLQFGRVLTPRETEVLGLIAGGYSNLGIADSLVLSVNTVERHVTNLYAKIGARNRADATAYALQATNRRG